MRIKINTHTAAGPYAYNISKRQDGLFWVARASRDTSPVYCMTHRHAENGKATGAELATCGNF